MSFLPSVRFKQEECDMSAVGSLRHIDPEFTAPFERARGGLQMGFHGCHISAGAMGLNHNCSWSFACCSRSSLNKTHIHVDDPR